MVGHAELMKKSADLLILSVLAEERLYGYAISKRIAARSDGQVKLGPGVLYPLLHQMEQQGMLLSSWEEVQAEGRDVSQPGRKRKWYRLSAKGKRRLAQRIAAHRSYQRLIESFLPDSTGTSGGIPGMETGGAER